MSNKALAAEQLRRALQLFVQTLDDDAALEVATVFPAYAVGRAYAVGDMFSYGENRRSSVVQGGASAYIAGRLEA